MRVLVTRPQPGADRTAKRLRALGHEAVIVPMSDILPLRSALPAGKFDAVVASSANSFRYLPRDVAERLGTLPFYAVGKETAAVGKQFGFIDPSPGAASASDLARDLVADLKAPARVAYICGAVRMDTLEEQLSAAGISVVAVETYDTQARKIPSSEIAELERAPIDAVLVYSAKAADALVGVAKPLAGTIFRDTAFIAISPRVRDRLVAGGILRVAASASPDEDAMFELLARADRRPASF